MTDHDKVTYLPHAYLDHGQFHRSSAIGRFILGVVRLALFLVGAAGLLMFVMVGAWVAVVISLLFVIAAFGLGQRRGLYAGECPRCRHSFYSHESAFNCPTCATRLWVEGDELKYLDS